MKIIKNIIECLVAFFISAQNLNAQENHNLVNTSTEFKKRVDDIKKHVDKYNTVIFKITNHDDQGMHDFLAVILPLVVDKQYHTCFMEIRYEHQSKIDKFMNNKAITFKNIFPDYVNSWFMKLEVVLNSLRKNHIKTVCSDGYGSDIDLEIQDKFTLEVVKKTSSAKNIIIIGANHFSDLEENEIDSVGVISLYRGYPELGEQKMIYTYGSKNIEIPMLYSYMYRDDNLLLNFSEVSD